MIPDELREAARRGVQRHGVLESHPSDGLPSELSIAHANGQRRQGGQLARVVAVVTRDESNKTVVVQLATNETENATDFDLIVNMGEAGVPFALAIQSELYGPLFSDQLDGVIGMLGDRELHAVANALLTDGESLEGLLTGAPLGAAEDPRRAFKEHELDDLESLTSACRLWLAGARSADAVIDPRLLVPPTSGTPREVAEDQFLELLDAVAALGEGPIEIPSEFFEGTDDFLDAVLRWRRDFGLDASRILTRVRITEVDNEPLEDVPRDEPADLSPLEVPSALRSYLSSCARAGRPMVDVQSVRRCWGEQEVFVLTRAGHRYCRTRAHFVEAA
jgi:hypothetical protein